MTDRAQEGDLATQLHDWATTEMHFHPQGPYLAAAMPTAADLKRYKFVDFVVFVVKVRTFGTAAVTTAAMAEEKTDWKF